MKGLIKRMHKGNAGFTLVELVVVIAILGVLAAIALPNFVGVTDDGQTQAGAMELDMVQTAVDALMVSKGASSLATTSPVTATADALVDTVGEATNDMSAFPYSDGDWALRPASGTKYLREATSAGTYYVDADGTVHQADSGY